MSEDGDIEQYEQNEVLWAKIRGFPWWPAYVDSQLARWMKYIQMTSNNKFNIQSYFSVIILSTYQHKQKYSSRLGPQKLRKFLQSYASFYTKAKTNHKLKIAILKAEERLRENQQNVSIYEQLRNSIKNKRKVGAKTDQRGSQIQNQDDQPQQSKENHNQEKSKTIQQKGKQKKAPKYQKSGQQDEIESLKQYKKGNRLRNILNQNRQVFHSAKKYEEHSQSVSIRNEKLSQKKSKGKKGRPKKPEVQPKESSSQNDFEQKPLIKRKSTFPRQERESTLSSHQLQNLEKIKKCLNDKQELISILSKISITSNNVKQILDLGTSSVLLEGQMTKQVYIILQSMKATLLHKYFPDDLKMKKKYERMNKKKKNIFKFKAQESEDDKKQMDLRKKTILKLQKILRKSGVEDVKDLSTRVQESFHQKSQLSGQKYTNIAYNYMRKLKMKVQEKQSSERIVEYLHQITDR